MGFHESMLGKLGTSANRWVSYQRGPPHTSTTAASISMRSIGLGRLLLAISRIDVSPFPLLPLSLLPLSQGCGWLLPALTLMTDVLYRHRPLPPRPRRTTRGTVARSEESAPALRATRMSARVFPRFQGAARTACRGPGTPPLIGLGMNTKPRAMPRWANGGRDSAWFCSDRKGVLRCTFHWQFLRAKKYDYVTRQVFKVVKGKNFSRVVWLSLSGDLRNVSSKFLSFQALSNSRTFF